MILYPAVDVLDGKAVRLTQGDYEREQVYYDDPLDAALNWVEQGAEWLHVINLDGARTGEKRNLDHLRRICAEAGVPVQYGGGLRDMRSIADALDAGAARAIVGTAAFADPPLIKEAVKRYGERIVVSLDTRDRKIATQGWQESTEIGYLDAARRLAGIGVKIFVFTEIERDGTLQGQRMVPLVELSLAVPEARLIASGGVGGLYDLERLADLSHRRYIENIDGVIVGQALFLGQFTVAEAQAALSGEAGKDA